MTTLQTLKLLVDLQEIDLRIHCLEKDKYHIPARMNEIEETLSTEHEELTAEKNQLDEAELARRMLESDLRAEKEKIKKWEARLNEIKSNRDYLALSREIEAARKANLGIEDEILKRMQDIEDLKTNIAQRDEDLDSLKKKLSEEMGELEAKLKSINATIGDETTVRDSAKETVNGRWLEQYDTIRKSRDGLAVVAVLDEHCQGCHMGIPPQLYNIILRGEQIETCPFCHRILFYKQSISDLNED